MIALLIVLELVGALRWYRIVTGAVPARAGAIDSVEWLRPDAQRTPPPRCFVSGSGRWWCWAVAVENTGVVVLHSGSSLWWRSTDHDASAELRPARWGRLIIITGPPRSGALRVAFGKPVLPPAGRFRAIRLDTGTIPDARAVVLPHNAVWIAGESVPQTSWVEIVSDRTAPAYLALEEIASVPAAVPLHLTLTEARPVEGRVVGLRDHPAAGALITVFRLIDPPPADSSRPLPRRVLAAESIADETGRFTLPALGEADYEVVAWHPQLGRASLPMQATENQVVIRLRASGVARGRVLIGGQPVEGVDVISVPDVTAFAAAPDMIEVKGGDAKSGPDGRFMVMVAPSGGGELRIGGGAHPVKRIPLPRAPVPVFDAGDVDLGRAIPLVVVLDRDPGCEVRAVGPVGRTGLHLVSATRIGGGAFEVSIPESGLWEFTLVCRRDAPALHPSVVQIDPSQAGKEVRLIVR